MGSGPVRLVDASCILCGASKRLPLTVQNSYSVVECASCGFVYVSPRPAEGEYERLYVDYLPQKMEDPYAWKRYMRLVFSETADRIEAALPEKGRCLDIGCGFGFFVEEMKGRGWEAFGIDISRTAVEFARSIGLDSRLGTIEEPGFAEGSFDAITMFYVLEHLTDPLDALRRVKALLKPGGVLAIRVPHTTPIVRLLDLFRIKNNLYDPPFHLSDFSPESARRILEKAGFTGIDQIIGGATLPPKAGPYMVSVAFNTAAELLYRLSAGRLLLPGVSKTTLARKPRQRPPCPR